MPRTQHQVLGDYGEIVVTRLPCPKCKHERTLRRLPVNFRCADVICDFCGNVAQVKATRQADVDKPPRSLMGSAWAPQKERMDAGIYFPLFIVVVNQDRSAHAVYYLPADLQHPQMFQQRQTPWTDSPPSRMAGLSLAARPAGRPRAGTDRVILAGIKADLLIRRLCHAHPRPAHFNADLAKQCSLLRSRGQH